MRTDEDIKRDVVDQLYWDTRVEAAKVEVLVDNGTVTLAGGVPSYQAKNAAYDDTWTVAGIKSVINRLEVRYPTTLTPPADADIKTAVENALRYDAHIFTYKIDVTVKKCWVTLLGTVDTYWRKRQAEETASKVYGVSGVTNELGVVPTEKISDEIIARQVINAIRRNTNAHIDEITITINNGEVTLTGTVPSYAVKQAIYNAAYYTAGVVNVHDQIGVSQHLLELV